VPTLEKTIEKIRTLPEPLVQEVDAYIDFLLVRSDQARWEMLTKLAETIDVGEGDMADYLANLEDYENRLAAGEIRW
jgi:hypothetical protein